MLAAVLPARGGSKRIARKNVKDFLGKPIIEYPIDAAKRSGLFDAVIVSTDDEDIAEVARGAGASVPFRRPEELANDHATTVDAVAHTLRWLQESGNAPTAICCIYPTAVFFGPELLRRSYEMLSGGDWDYVFTAARFSNPVYRSFTANASGGTDMLFPDQFYTRSQDLPDVYHDAAQFYWGRPEAWLANRPFFSSRSTFAEIPGWRVEDIDTPEDWKRAEEIYERHHHHIE